MELPKNLKKAKKPRGISYAKHRLGILAAYKLAKGCADCGYKLHYSALQFDHIKGVKNFTIGKSLGKAWHKLLK